MIVRQRLTRLALNFNIQQQNHYGFATCSQNIILSHQRHLNLTSKIGHQASLLTFVRPLSTKDIFFKEAGDIASQIPLPPLPPGAKASLAEMAAAGESVLEELELWAWWKPSAWLRWGLEFGHFYFDLPWCASIAALTVIVRLSLIFVPIKMQRYSSLFREFKPEMQKFRERTLLAQREGDHMASHQITMEQNAFMKEKNINPIAFVPMMMCNGAVFMSQFFAIRGMATAKYPGFQDGGLFWFKDLTVGDPYWILPTLSAITVHFVMKSGIDTGTTDMMAPIMRPLFHYGFPAVVLVFSMQFPSALCVYWVTNNALSMIISYTFRISAVRRVLSLPEIVETPEKGIREEFSNVYKNMKTKAHFDASSPISMKQEDFEQFQRAGRAKPVFMVDEQQRGDETDEQETKNKEKQKKKRANI